MRSTLIAVGLLTLAACASDPYHDQASKPPVYGERPGETQAFADALIFGPESFSRDGVAIDKR